MVEPVVRQQTPYGIGIDFDALQVAPHGYPVDWNNRGGDVEVTLTPESFRPSVPWISEQDEYVILARDTQADTVALTWVLTEDDNDAVTKGELEVPTAKLVDAAGLFKAAFFEDH